MDLEIDFGRDGKPVVLPVQPGETLLWRGTPRRFVELRVIDLPMILFGLFHGGVMWSLHLAFGVPPAVAVAGSLCSLLGAVLMPVHRAFWLRRTEYLVTDQRVLLAHVLLRKTTLRELRYQPDAPPRILHRAQDGTGTLVCTPPTLGGTFRHFLPQQQFWPMALHAVAEPERVCAVITAAWRRAVSPHG